MYYKSFRSLVILISLNRIKILCKIFVKFISIYYLKILNLEKKVFRFNKIINQKKFYTNQQEISKIYTLINLFTLVIRKGHVGLPYSTVKNKNNTFIEHKQESILIFNVDHNQPYYAREYEIQVDGIKIKEGKEFTES